MFRQTEKDRYRGGVSGVAVKAGVLLCLVSILFGLIVMVIGAMLSSDDDVPEVYAWLGSGACLAFTVGMLLAFVGWLIRAASD